MIFFQDIFFFYPKNFLARRREDSQGLNKLIHSGQFVKIPFGTYVRLLDSLEYN